MKRRLLLAWRVLRGANPRSEGYMAALQDIDKSLAQWSRVRLVHNWSDPDFDPLTPPWMVRFEIGDTHAALSTGPSPATILLVKRR